MGKQAESSPELGGQIYRVPLMEHQAYLLSNQYRLRRDVRPVSDKEINRQIRISSPNPV